MVAKRNAVFALGILIYAVLSIVYTYPGYVPLLNGDTKVMMGNGVDPVIFPYIFSFFQSVFKTNPAALFYGSVYTPMMDYPQGLFIWDPLIERLMVMGLSPFVVVEQIGTAIVILSLFFNALSAWMLGRALQIPHLISWAMGIAWAFNPYTRAAAKVFMGLTGIYHIPLFFLGIYYLSTGKKRDTIKACSLFFLISIMPHYYVVVLAALSPLGIAFYLALRSQGTRMCSFLGRAFIAALPAVLWLVFSLIVPAPSHVKTVQSPFPDTAKTDAEYHPFLDMFAAQPTDYLTGDIGLGDSDIIPLRGALTREVLDTDYPKGHTHDRAVGVRWTILLIALVAVIFLLPSSKSFWLPTDRKVAIVFLLFGILSFWFALPPHWPIPSGGGSYWVNLLVSQVRTPSRAGIGVAFAAIFLTGLYLKNLQIKYSLSSRKSRYLGVTLIALLILELPPFLQEMPMSVVKPVYSVLAEKSECGVGMRWPYVSLAQKDLSYLSFIQRMRGTSCSILNSSVANLYDKKFIKLLSQRNLDREKALLEFSTCAEISWIVMGPEYANKTGESLCGRLGWSWSDQGVCHRAGKRGNTAKIDYCVSNLGKTAKNDVRN